MTELMLDLAGVTVGSQVLDLGAGTGDQTLLAARRIGTGGMVLATDISASMLALTQEAARAADAERWREISVSTDVKASVSLPGLRF